MTSPQDFLRTVQGEMTLEIFTSWPDVTPRYYAHLINLKDDGFKMRMNLYGNMGLDDIIFVSLAGKETVLVKRRARIIWLDREDARVVAGHFEEPAVTYK